MTICNSHRSMIDNNKSLTALFCISGAAGADLLQRCRIPLCGWCRLQPVAIKMKPMPGAVRTTILRCRWLTQAPFWGRSRTRNLITMAFGADSLQKTDVSMSIRRVLTASERISSSSYTFGVTPLQQYLVEFDDGRLQAFPVAWDTRPKEDGGQHWFHLYPEENIGPGDPLYWTGPNQNWNFMCAECHSTNLRRNYDASVPILTIPRGRRSTCPARPVTVPGQRTWSGLNRTLKVA